MSDFFGTPHALLTTKLIAPPPAHAFVARPRLVARLNQVLEQRALALVSAPAGFGKSSLVAAWCREHPMPTAWLALDAEDNDPQRFLMYLLAALDHVSPEPGLLDEIALLARSPQAPSLSLLLTRVIQLLHENLTTPSVLVLDDYQFIETRAIHDALVFFIEHRPHFLHVVMTTRVDPQLPLSRWRVRSLLVELRQADLRFTLPESERFLQETMALSLTSDEIATLESRTEGWIAGLQLFALSLRGQANVARFIQNFTGSHRYIFDYLVEEVLRQQPEPLQDFLRDTCILERLSAPLCNAVTESFEGQSNLEQLERSNLFVTALDEARVWYRYHALFADVLRHRLQHTQPARVLILHQRASEWFEQAGQFNEAIQHALVGKNFERAADLMERNVEMILNRGEVATLQRWLRGLPTELLRARPSLSLARAYALTLTRELDAAEQSVADAERAIDVGAGATQRQIRGEAAAIRAGIAIYRNDVAGALALAHAALTDLAETKVQLRGQIMLYLGLAFTWTDKLAEAGQAFGESSRLAQAADDLYTALSAIQNLAWIQALEGKLGRAAATYRHALALAQDKGVAQMAVLGGTHWELGMVLYEWNDLEGAAQHIHEAIQKSERGGLPVVSMFSYLCRARLNQAQQDLAAASEAIQKAHTLVEKFNLPLRYAGQYTAEQVRLWLAEGNLNAAALWLETTPLAEDAAFDYLHEPLHIARARVLIAQGHAEQALKLLTRLRHAAETVGRVDSAFEIMALQVIASQQGGDAQATLTLLEQTLSLARSERYIRTFVDEGEPFRVQIAGFLNQQRRSSSTKRADPNPNAALLLSYCEQLLAAFPSSHPAPKPQVPTRMDLSHPNSELRVERLTERELQVLDLIAKGLDNQEIAQSLIVEISTVKKHIHNLFGKLDVNTRTQAIARARALGLLA
jgi:LuxR family transcriptional regulator, maltose regulon positive regulatory protein